MGSCQLARCKVSHLILASIFHSTYLLFRSTDPTRVFTEPEEVFDMPGLDAVVISTITSTHAPLTLKAVAKGLVSVFILGFMICADAP